MKTLFLSMLTFVALLAHCQTLENRFHVAIICDNLMIKKIPSYTELHGVPFDIKDDGARNNANAQASFELGYKIQRQWKGTKKIYTGLIIGYRRTHLTYQNQQLYYLKFFDGDS